VRVQDSEGGCEHGCSNFVAVSAVADERILEAWGSGGLDGRLV
jgi:hypothetical protein